MSFWDDLNWDVLGVKWGGDTNGVDISGLTNSLTNSSLVNNSIYGDILKGFMEILPFLNIGSLDSLFGKAEESPEVAKQLSSNLTLANKSITDAQSQYQQSQAAVQAAQQLLNSRSGYYSTNYWGGAAEQRLNENNRWHNQMLEQQRRQALSQAQANMNAAQSNVTNFQKQMDEFNAKQTEYNSPAALAERMKSMSDPSGLTNTEKGGSGALTNMFGNLLRGGKPEGGVTSGGFRITDVPGLGQPSWGSGSEQFAQGQGPSIGQGQYGKQDTGSGNYGDIGNMLGQFAQGQGPSIGQGQYGKQDTGSGNYGNAIMQLMRSFGGGQGTSSNPDWKMPDFKQQQQPNLGFNPMDMPNPSINQGGSQVAAPGQSSIAGLGGISNMPINPGVGQGGIALAGQGYGGGFGSKSMAGMFGQQEDPIGFNYSNGGQLSF